MVLPGIPTRKNKQHFPVIEEIFGRAEIGQNLKLTFNTVGLGHPAYSNHISGIKGQLPGNQT
jgi:hypothetical protein